MRGGLYSLANSAYGANVMDLQHTDRFDKVADAVFEKLLSAFPLPASLNAFTLGFSHLDPSQCNEAGQPIVSSDHPDRVFVMSVVAVLVNFGYVRGNVHSLYISSAVLTEQGLLLFGPLPRSLRVRSGR